MRRKRNGSVHSRLKKQDCVTDEGDMTSTYYSADQVTPHPAVSYSMNRRFGDSQRRGGTSTVSQEARGVYRSPVPAASRVNLSQTYPPLRGRGRGIGSLQVMLQEPSHRAVMLRKSAPSLTDDDDLTEDGMTAVDGRTKKLFETPEHIPAEYERVPATPRRKRTKTWLLTCLRASYGSSFDNPDDMSVIRIVHEHADCQKLGDEYGARLRTYKYEDKSTGQCYYQHFLTDIEPNSPADKMEIHEFDELVLLNNDFVPNLTHEQVIEELKHVPVDSCTHLTLILRRVVHEAQGFSWIRSSAILIPVYKREPEVKKVHVEDLGSRAPMQQTWTLLKVIGEPFYVSEESGKVTVEKLKNNDTDLNREVLLTWRLKSSVNRSPKIIFEVSLQFRNKSYLVMNKKTGEGEIKNNVAWYNYTSIGRRCIFQLQDQDGKYIGYSYDDEKITLVPDKYEFEKYEPRGTWDHADGCEKRETNDVRRENTSRHFEWSSEDNSFDSGNSSLDLSQESISPDNSPRKRPREDGYCSASHEDYHGNGFLSDGQLPKRSHGMVTRQMSATTPTKMMTTLSLMS